MANVVKGIYTSKPNAQGKGGGVEYVEVTGPDAGAILYSQGAAALFRAAGLKAPDGLTLYYGANGYGDQRMFYVRVQRDTYEGKARPMRVAKDAAPRLRPYAPSNGSNASILSEGGKKALAALSKSAWSATEKMAQAETWQAKGLITAEDVKLIGAALGVAAEADPFAVDEAPAVKGKRKSA